VLAATGVALVAFACAPQAHECPLLAVGILAFLFVQAFLPACRISVSAPLCPGNIAQGFYWVQLVLVTVLIGYFGFSQGTLPHMPSPDAINVAIMIHVVGYLSFSLAYQCFHTPAVDESVAPAPRNARGTAYLIVPFAAIGLLGLYLAHGGIDEFIEYISSPARHREHVDETATPEGAAGSFLKHFLGFAVVLAWSW